MKKHDMKMYRSAKFSHFFRSEMLSEEELGLIKLPVQFLQHSVIASIAIPKIKKKGGTRSTGQGGEAEVYISRRYKINLLR